MGFMFSPDKKQVLLIEKLQPLWQTGLLNGVGGKIEKDETPIQAMVREFKEEVGMDVEGWGKLLTMNAHDGIVHFFTYTCLSDAFFNTFRKVEEEQPVAVAVKHIHKVGCVSNLLWMVPLAQQNNTKPFTLYEE